MTRNDTSAPVARLAARLECDIRSRGLSPGDPYLTAQQAADLLGVSPTTCHRALRLLAERDVVLRRPHSGTFVGPNFQSRPSSLVRSVHVLASAERRPGDLIRDDVYSAIARELPGVGLHFTVPPVENEARYVEELLTRSAAAGEAMGIIASSCRREVYRLLARQSVPTVVVGSVDRADDRLASVAGDERQAGHLLAEHMLGQDYRQFAVLMNETWRPGDNLFLEGVEAALREAGLPAGALRVRSLSRDRTSFAQQARRCLSEASDRLAVICQDPTFAFWLDELRASELSLAWHNLGLAYNADLEPPSKKTAYPCVYQEASAAQMLAIAAQLLARLWAGEEVQERHVVLPMALYVPV